MSEHRNKLAILIHAIMFHHEFASASWKGEKVDDGFIKLHRSILDWEWFQDDKTFKVFLYLLLNANWEDSRFRGYDIPRGSLVIGYTALSKRLGISVRSVRTAISHLKSTGELTIKTTNKFSIATIVNWEKYQGRNESVNTQTNTQLNTQSTLNQHSTNTIKEYKNIRNKEYYKANSRYETEYDFDAMEREYGLK